MSTVIRRLEDADLEAVLAFSLEAWAPVFASLEGALGPNVYGRLFPDWRSAQANAIEATCTTPENDVSVAVVEGRPVGFVAIGSIDEDATPRGRDPHDRRRSRPHERFDFNPLPLMRYYRTL